MKAPTPTWFWQLMALGVVIGVVGVVIAADVEKTVGVVIVCISAVLFLFLKQARYQQLSRARRANRSLR